MENKKKKKIKLPLEAIALVFLFAIFLFYRGGGHFAYGGMTGDINNIRGYAWSSNYGWISMNCLDNDTCGTVVYGVRIYDFTAPSQTFNFGGHAWSPSVGWISFQHDLTDPNPPDNNNFASQCNNSNCTISNGCTACYNPSDGNIYGWARVLSFGNDGWISLGTTTAPAFQASIDQASASSSFLGWGWNGNTESYKGLGWVSFSCANTDTCATANYFAYLASSHLPVPQNLSAPNYSTSTACLGVAKNAYLNWNFYDQDCAGNCQTAFEVIVNTSNSTSTWKMKSKKYLSVTQYNASNTSGLLDYDMPYYWWVRVWDNFGFVSKWVQFNSVSPGHALTDNNARNAIRGNSQTFTTFRHEMPDPFFHKVPADVLAYYPVTSTDASFYFTTSSPSTAAACNNANCAWRWTGIGNISNSATTSSSTVMTFSYGSNRQVNLRVKDQDGYFCNTSSVPFFVDLLPIWIEKKAQ